jgi:uncharacterized membrane protein YdbT with pleckstrin-like domain
MSYVDEHLLAGENVVHRTKLHWVLFLTPAVIAGLLLLLFLPMAVGSGDLGTGATILLVFIVLSGLLFLGRFITYKTSEFAVTNKRVIIKVGFIRRRSLEVLLQKVEAIGVDQPILGRLLNYGTITVTGTGGSREAFPQITDPLTFRRKVQEHSPA